MQIDLTKEIFEDNGFIFDEEFENFWQFKFKENLIAIYNYTNGYFKLKREGDRTYYSIIIGGMYIHNEDELMFIINHLAIPQNQLTH